MDQNLGGSNVGSHRDIMHIAEAEQVDVVRLMGFGIQGIPEKQEQVHLIAGDARRDLLVAALRAGEEFWMVSPVASLTILPVVPVAQRLCRLRMPQ